MAPETPIAVVEEFYPELRRGRIHVKKGTIQVGDLVRILGKNGFDMEEMVTSLEVNDEPVRRAKAGERLNMLFTFPVNPGDQLFLSRSSPRG